MFESVRQSVVGFVPRVGGEADASTVRFGRKEDVEGTDGFVGRDD